MSQVVVADEHAILRTGLRALLERHRGLHIVAEAGDGRELLRAVEEVKQGVVVADIKPAKPSAKWCDRCGFHTMLRSSSLAHHGDVYE
jgi:DNA-binding NarL/FixJ family response regulator